MTAVDLALRAFLLIALFWAASVVIRAAIQGHRHGRDRIHAGASWSPRIPEQETRR